MPDLKFDFTLNNEMSSGLKEITNALSGILTYLEDVDKSIGGLENSNFDNLRKSVNQACGSIDTLSQSFDEATGNATSLNKSTFNNISSETGKLGKEIEGLGKTTVGTSSELDKLNNQDFSGLKKETKDTFTSIDSLKEAAQGSSTELEKLGDVKLGRLKDEAGNASASLDDIGSASSSAVSDLNKLSNTSLSGIKSESASASASIGKIGSEASGSLGDLKRIDSFSMSGLKSEAQKAASGIDKIGTSASGAKSELKEISKINLDNGSAQSLADSMEKLKGAVDVSNFLNIAEIVGEATDKLKDFAGAAMDAAETVGSVSNKIEIGLDLPDDELKEIQSGAFSAYLNNFGDSYDEIVDKAIYAKQLLGDKIDSSQMDRILAQYQTLEDAGMDYNETLRGANSMAFAWGSTLEHAADMFTTAQKRGLNFSDELGDNMAEYASLFKDTGFTDADIFAIGDIGKQSGAYNLDKVLDFMKEFKITLNDGTFEENAVRFGGVDSETFNTFAKFQDGAASAKDVFNAMLSDLSKLPKVAGDSLLSDVFSSLGEDNASDTILAMQNYQEVAQDVYSNVSGAAQAAADANGTAVGQLRRYWEALPLALAPIGDAIASTIVGIVDIASSIGSTIAGLWNGTITFPDLTQQGLQAIDQFINGFMAGLPDMITQGWNAITNFITGVMQKAPELALEAVDMILAFIQSIGENFPTLIQRGGEMLLAFSQGLKDNLPIIISNGIEAIGSWMSGLLQRLPDIISAGMQLITGLATGLIDALPYILSTAWNIISGLAGAIISNLPTIISTGLDIISSLVVGIATAVPTLIYEGFQLIVKLAASIVSAVPQLLYTMGQIANDMIMGLVSGLAGIWNVIPQWFGEHFGWIIDWVKNLFGIASPSTVFSEIGDNLLGGFLGGLSNAWGSIANWFTEKWQWLKDTVGSWWSNLFGGGEDNDTQPNIDYSETINNVKAQMEQLRAEVEAGFNAITTNALQATAVMAGQTLAAYQVLGGQITAETAVIAANVNAQFLTIDLSPLGSKLSAEMNIALTAMGSLALQKTAELVLGMTAQIEPLKKIFSDTFSIITTGIQTALSVLYNQAIDQLNKMAVDSANTISQMSQTVINTLTSMTQAALLQVTILTESSEQAISQMSLDINTNITLFKTAFVGIWNLLSIETLAVLERFISQAISDIERFINDVTKEINKMPGVFSTAATNAMKSFIDGINANRQGAVDATSQLVQAVKDAFIKGLGIHSPSDETYWFGLMTGIGFINGLSDSQVAEFAKNTLNNIVDAFVAGKFNADELVDFLGEDTIKVINAIQGDPELMEKANMFPGMGSASSIVEAARKYIDYRSPWGNNNSMFNQRLGQGAGAWCAMFVKAMADEAGVYFPNLYYVPAIYDWAHQTGRWTTTPQIGDAVIFGSGKGSHIEIVSGIPGNGMIQSIGGNTGNPPGVYEHVRGGVLGYVRLDGSSAAGSGDQAIAYPLIGTRGTQTSWFGPRPSPGGIGSTNHGGVDLAAPIGTPIASALAGSVSQSGWNGGYGQSVTVTSGDIDIIYGHMSQILAGQGQQVGKGQQIGLVGSTGRSTGPHLHFEMHKGGQRIDPQPYIDGSNISVGGGGLNLITTLQNAYNKKYGGPIVTATSGSVAYNPSAGVEQWRPTVLQALNMLGQSTSLVDGVLNAIDHESSGNPNDTNNWDSNAAAGDPSRGLLQTIGSTFNTYRNPSLSSNIFDPLANIYAALNYMIHRYGSIADVVYPRPGKSYGAQMDGSWKGYAVGTRYVPYDMLAPIHEGEAIIPKSQNPYTHSGGNYLEDMFDFEPHLRAESSVYSEGGGSNTVSIRLQITQNITDRTNPKDCADEILDILYQELDEEFKSVGGGVSLAY